jgi:class 3 adenylate cyclase
MRLRRHSRTLAQPPIPSPELSDGLHADSSRRMILGACARNLPTGTVTFLFTDVEGSTRLLHSLGAEGYADALAEQRPADFRAAPRFPRPIRRIVSRLILSTWSWTLHR